MGALVRADQTTISEDDASQEAYNGGFDSGKNGGTGFGEWKMTSDGRFQASPQSALAKVNKRIDPAK